MFEREKVEATVKVVNVVASATLGQRVNLDSVIEGFPNAEFPSKRFPGLVFRLKKPKTATLIFRSGKIICAGGRSENEASKAVENVIRELTKRGIIIPKKSEVKINNIVASANLRRTVDLESASMLQGTMFEPDQFPALIYRMDDPKVVFLIFSTGRLICVGAKNEEEIHKAIRKLVQKLDVAGASKSPSFDRPDTDSQMKCVEGIPVSRFKLRDFTFSDSQGKACVFVDGLWCNNKLCDGSPCKFANLIQRKLVDGLYGYWGFHWQQGWYTTETKKSQRKFNN
ncbi:MAG: TATA-box-binding protein [Candidatus Bathyarchaeota archaeon]|nr:TATA-box-binding protein [Candidatus Bathyarchaeota archaeon]